ncbi:MAG: ribosome silencing factor [Chloroflexi bacterium]|nr:ribosome silencing factor [Chloroflexota bacterium]
MEQLGIEPIELARFIVDTAADKKAEDIILLDIIGLSAFFDYFVICSASSDRQIKAIVDGVVQAAKDEYGKLARSVEGDPESGWVLIDFTDVVVHVFSHDSRTYYSLENLWQDASVLLKIQ